MAKASKAVRKTYTENQLQQHVAEAYKAGQESPTAAAREQFREIGFQQGYKAAFQAWRTDMRALGLLDLYNERADEVRKQVFAREFV